MRRRSFLSSALQVVTGTSVAACSTSTPVRSRQPVLGSSVNKTIIYCLDGTWNGTTDDRADAPSNVYHLFSDMCGDARERSDAPGELRTEEKQYSQDGLVTQIALYCHGVGANRLNGPMHVLGGALGSGLTTRIRQGYVFISRNYTAGDRIVLIGFSRGAYGVRALGDMIARQGVLKKQFTDDHSTLSHSAGAWLRYRALWPSPTREDNRHGLQEIVQASEAGHRFELEALGKVPNEDAFLPAKVRMLAVFDTVGAMGFPEDRDQVRVDNFGFVSEELLENIDAALHVVSLDEERRDFTPSLWKDSAKLKQILFPGAHSDIGGGYRDDHSLADCALLWMFRNLQPIVTFAGDGPRGDFGPSAVGLRHTPWHGVAAIGRSARDFSGRQLIISKAIRERMAGGEVRAEREKAAQYIPANLPKPGYFQEE